MEDKINKTSDTDPETFANICGTEDIPNFSQICRVCLCETNENDHRLDTVILLLNKTQKIRSLLEDSTGEQILNLEYLPNNICDRCFRILTAWYKIRSQTQRSNEIFKKYFNKLSNSLDGKSLPSTDLTIHKHGENLNAIQTQNVIQMQDFQVSVVQDKPEVVGFIFHCDSCIMTFTNQFDLDKHQEVHNNKPSKKKSHKCEICTKTFAFQNGLYNHMKFCRRHLSQHKYQCDVCKRQYNSPNSFKKHTRKTCVPVDLIEQCKTRKLDISKEELIAISDKTIRETKMSCILCKKNFKSRPDFLSHLPKHNNDKKCSLCRREFSRVSRLEQHVRMHMRAKVYACPMCSRTFYTIEAFRHHMKDHGKREWIFRCNVCQKEFFIEREFDIHMVKHLEDIENKKKALKNTAVEDVVEFGVENVDIVNEHVCKISQKDDSKNNSTNQIESDILSCREPSHSVKVDEDSKGNKLPISKKVVVDSQLIKTESRVPTSYLKARIKLRRIDRNILKTHALKVKEKKPGLKHNVQLENHESENSLLEENPDENNDEISTLSKSNDQISEKTKKILDKCKVNCHVAGCQTMCFNLNEIWQHITKEHYRGEKPFKCCRCIEEFEDKNAFRLHIRKYYTFKCPICFKLKKSSSELRKHVILTHSNYRPLKCSKCDQTFKRPGALKVHETTHSYKKQFVCNVCFKDFFSQNGLYLHSKSHKNIKELQCPTCGVQLSTRDRIKRHIENKSCAVKQKNNVGLEDEKVTHEKSMENDGVDILGIDTDNENEMESRSSDEVYVTTNQIQTIIPNCKEQFQRVKEEKDSENDIPNKPERKMSFEMEMDHSLDIDDCKPQLELMETECNLQTTSQLVNEISTDHQIMSVENNQLNEKETVQLENPESDNSCSEDEDAEENDDESGEIIKNLLENCKVNCHVAGCQTKCSNLSEIWEHLEKDHLYGNKPYNCSECHQTFTRKRPFRFHMYKYYSFKCPFCSETKKNSYDIKRHVMHTHSVDRPFKCSKCDKKFNSSGALKIHENIHSDKKEFVCSICFKEFFSHKGLYFHSKSHRTIKELQCTICSIQFSSKSHLKRHVKLNTCNRKKKKVSEEVIDIESNISGEDDSKNESTNEITTDPLDCEESFQLVKEEDFKGDDPNESVKDTLVKTESPEYSSYQWETDMPKNSDDKKFSKNATELKIADETVKVEKHESDNFR